MDNLIIKTLTSFVSDIQLGSGYKEEYDTQILQVLKYIKTLAHDNKKFKAYCEYLKTHLQPYEQRITYIMIHKKVSKKDYDFLFELNLFDNEKITLNFKDIFENDNKNTKRILVEYCYNILQFLENGNKPITKPEIVKEKQKKNSKNKGGLESLLNNDKLMSLVTNIARDMNDTFETEGVNNTEFLSGMMNSLVSGDITGIAKNKAFSNIISQIEGKITTAIENGDIDTKELDVSNISLDALQDPGFIDKLSKRI